MTPLPETGLNDPPRLVVQMIFTKAARVFSLISFQESRGVMGTRGGRGTEIIVGSGMGWGSGAGDGFFFTTLGEVVATGALADVVVASGGVLVAVVLMTDCVGVTSAARNANAPKR